MNKLLKEEYDSRMESYKNWLEEANKRLKKSTFYAALELPSLANAVKESSRKCRVYAAEAYNSALRLRNL